MSEHPLSAPRKEIDSIDDQILDLLERRFEIFTDVGQIKTSHNLEIVQTERVAEVLKRVTSISKDKGLPVQIIHDFYKNIIDEAHRIEGEIKLQNSKRA